MKCTTLSVFFCCFFNLPLSPLSLCSSVTLLDSVSALGDLGWEAYPAEGVSSTCRTDSNDFHRHSSRPQVQWLQPQDLIECGHLIIYMYSRREITFIHQAGTFYPADEQLCANTEKDEQTACRFRTELAYRVYVRFPKSVNRKSDCCKNSCQRAISH